MKKALNAWSVPPSVDFESMFRALSKAGFDGVELNVDGPGRSAHSLTMDGDGAWLADIRALSEKYRLPVCSISTSLYGASLGGDAHGEAAAALLRRQLECARALGADGILAVPGGLSEEVSMLRARDNALGILSALRREIEDSGVFVGLENVWNNFFLSPLDMASFIDQLGSPAIGAYFDVGNVMIFSHPHHWIEVLGRRIGKVHVKDFSRAGANAGHFVNLLEGDVRWPRVIAALRQAGYDGYLTAELPAIDDYPEYLYDITGRALDLIIGK
ncbi:MAG: sugar phosphate isomerase/epimerase [Clostridiales bacterium]|nr:sugar phosphate isomerase/epimerase [Clostridiales bacterium]